MSIATEHLGPVRRPTEIEHRILFPCRIGAPQKDHREALDIAHRLNMTLLTAKVPTHIRIYWLDNNEKGNLIGLMAPVSTSSMLLL